MDIMQALSKLDAVRAVQGSGELCANRLAAVCAFLFSHAPWDPDIRLAVAITGLDQFVLLLLTTLCLYLLCMRDIAHLHKTFIICEHEDVNTAVLNCTAV